MRTGVKPTYLDLFAGCGGLSLGFLQAGFRPLLAIDSDPQAVACYNFNHPDGEGVGAVQADMGTFKTHDDVAAFLENHGIRDTNCDVLVGGPPCQSFSMVGRTKVRALIESDEKYRAIWEKRSEKRTMLFEAYVLFLEYLQPRWFLFENVPSIRSHEAFARIRSRFNSLRTPDGRSLEYTILPDNYWASDFGVPQNRRRFLMVGYRSDAGIPGWAVPARMPEVSVGEAISDLPAVPNGHKGHELPYQNPPLSEYQRLIRQTPSGEASAAVYNHIGRSHNADDVALFGVMKQGAKFSDDDVQEALFQINQHHKLLKYSTEKFKDKLHKLDSERPSWTVTAHLQKDCYKFIHYAQARTITVREAARLQSFPDGFVFPSALGVAYRLIGNAVPPMLARAFASSFCASDAGLMDRRERIRGILPDEDWKQILLTLGDTVTSERERWYLRAAIAGGVLVRISGKPWSDAARLLGLHSSLSLERAVNRLERNGTWELVRPVLPVPLQGNREQDRVQYQMDMAAD